MTTENPKILIVDDDSAIQRLLSKWLSNAGYRVESVGHAELAIESIEAECPSILITDWDLPNMDGISLCKWLRTQDLPKYVYTFMLTVHTGTADIIKGLEAGADDFLRKPIDRNELVARMKSGGRVLELERRLSQLANCDALTGLLTQRTFYKRFEDEWKKGTRHAFPISVVMLDIDFLKSVNDNLGHAAGDRVIRTVGRILEDNRRASDIVSRYGGEEFCILLPETDEAGAALWADRMRITMSELIGGGEATPINLTVSCGVAERLDDTRSPQDLVDMADQALLVAKRAGRNQVVEFRSISETGTIGDNSEVARLFSGLNAGEIMTSVVVGVSQDELISRAAQHILRNRIDNVPVVDDANNLVGMLTEKDIVSNMLKGAWSDKRVHDVMSHNVVRYEVNTPAISVYEFLCRVSVRSVFVVEDGSPVGIISRTSLLRWFANAVKTRGSEEIPRGGGARDGGASCLAAIRTIDAMGTEIDRLRGAMMVGEPGSNRTPMLIGAVSRLQEMVNDLLASSHYIDSDVEEENGEEGCIVGANAFC
jgi:two-component system cell cycle response regulator